MTTMIRTIIPAAALVLLVAIAQPAHAAELYEATLDGAQAGTGAPGTGTAVLVLSDDETAVAYEITYSGLTAAETMAHFHNGAPGVNGPVMFTLPLGTPKIGVWPITPDQVTQLKGGRVYVNVHTTAFPAGELRGNINFVTVPADETSWGGIKALYR